MRPWQRTLHARSRDTRYVLGAAGLIVLVFLAFAMVAELAQRAGLGFAHRLDAEDFDSGGLRTAALNLLLLQPLQRSDPALSHQITRLIDNAPLEPERKLLLHEYWVSLQAREPTQTLAFEAGKSPPMPDANFLVALVCQEKREAGTALFYARRELARFESRETWNLAVDLAVQTHDINALNEWLKNPAFRTQLSFARQLAVAQVLRDWPRLLLLTPLAYLSGVRAEIVALVGVATLVWFALLLQGICGERFAWPRVFSLSIALLLGICATFAALVAGYAIDQFFPVGPGKDVMYNLVYYSVCVALPEECIKLIFLLPLIPWLVRRNSESDALFVAAAVGLGFGAAETLGYVQTGGLSALLDRFLTSIIFHIAATGLAGLALARAFANVRRHLSGFGTTLAAVTCAHGVYNTFLTAPAETTLLSSIALLVLAIQFIDRIKQVREEGRDIVSLTATFVVGTALIAGCLLLVSSLTLGWLQSLQLISLSAVTNALLIFIFAKRLREVG
jgi:RsiW-degrading membrane proteinase PrsW (M82 family)